MTNTNQTKRTTTTHAPLQQFHHRAIEHKLSASAILLWQHLYFIGQEKGQYHNLCLRTADLTNTLHITRNCLQKIRHALVNAGVLQVRIDQRQNVWYTLCIDNITVSVGAGDPDSPQLGDPAPHKNQPGAETPPLQQQRHTVKQPSANILQDNTYRKQIHTFCTALNAPGSNTLDTLLLQFMHQRKTKGKTLTQIGLDVLLDKLITLSKGNIEQMINIVKQSMTKGWSGFYPCRQTNLATTGIYNATYTPNNKTSRISKYDTKYEDLDFLEW